MKLRTKLLFFPALFIFIIQCLPFRTHAGDIKARIVSEVDNQPIPFVCVRFSPDNSGTFTNIDGWFYAPDTVSLIRLNHYAFQPLTINPKELKGIVKVINMSPLQNAVSPSIDSLFKNTGLRLMKKVVKNRAHNDPEKYNSYSYTYLQNFNISSDLPLEREMIKGKLTDTLENSIVKSLTTKSFFSLEILSRKKMLQPDHMNEGIISAKYTGTANKPYLSLANELQDLSVYDQFFTVLNKSYFSPVSQDGLKKYYYVITDTLTIGNNDSIFIITFVPRRQKSVNTLQGGIFVNNHGFAVQAFSARLEWNDPAIPSISIHQQYDRISNDKWFPGEKLASVKLMLKRQIKKIRFFGI